MSDSTTLLVVLAAVYCVECLIWIPAGSFLFVSRRRRDYRAHEMEEDRRHLPALAPPLPPLGTSFLCAPPAAAVSPEGLSTRPSLRLEELFAVESEGRAVRAGGRCLLKAASPRAALALTELLRRLLNLAPDRRAATIDNALSDSLDAGAVVDRVEAFHRQTETLRWLCNMLFLHLFVAAPLAILWTGLPAAWLPLLLGLAVLQGLISIEFRSAHRALYPDEPQRRWTLLMTIVLSPPAAVRAVDTLGRDLLGDFHPAAVCAALLEPEEFAGVARRMLHDLRRFDRDGAPPDRVERWHRRHLGDALEALARGYGLGPAEMMRPPVPDDDLCLSYCPRCHEQYLIAEGQCGSCDRVGLRRFAETVEEGGQVSAPAVIRS